MARDYKQEFISKLAQKKHSNFELIGEYAGSKHKTLFKHVVCGFEWETSPYILLSAKEDNGCPKCQNNNKSLSQEVFIERLNKVGNYEYTLQDGTQYTRQANPLYLNHKICGTTFTTYWGTFKHNVSCPSCSLKTRKTRKKTPKDYAVEISKLYGDEYTLLSFYTSALEKVQVRHEVCGSSFKVRASHFLQGHACPYCSSSRGERFIRAYLNEHSFYFSEQVTFKECKNTKPLPFDFCIYTQEGAVDFLLEYDGIQHYKPYKFFGGVNKFNQQQINDAIKTHYCQDNKIKLIRIPYTCDSYQKVSVFLDNNC